MFLTIQDVLLCHDDELEGRRIAYIYYLVPPDWEKKDGGMYFTLLQYVLCVKCFGKTQTEVLATILKEKNSVTFLVYLVYSLKEHRIHGTN